jgi:sugar/nucleoside kinase (ribokinase family)
MAGSRDIDLIAAGHICLDIIPKIPETGATTIGEILTPGKLVQVGPSAISTGGPVSNTGIGVRKLGREVAFMAKVGDDAYGSLIQSMLEQHGSAEGISVAEGESSSYTIVLAPPGIDRIFLHCPGTNDSFTSDDVDYSLVERAKMFHLGYPPLMRALYDHEGAQLVETFRRAKAAGATTSLDMALPDPTSHSGKAPWHAILEKLLPFVDIFLPSLEEACYMLDPEECLRMKKEHGGRDLIDVLPPGEYRKIAERLLQMGTKMVVLKSGHRGYYFRGGNGDEFDVMGALPPKEPENWSKREVWCAAFEPGDIASATGSGDSSIAGFLTAYLHGFPLEQCLRTATCVGYENLQELDAVSGILSWDETLELLESGKLKPLDPNLGDDWKAHDIPGLWIGPEDGE